MGIDIKLLYIALIPSISGIIGLIKILLTKKKPIAALHVGLSIAAFASTIIVFLILQSRLSNLSDFTWGAFDFFSSGWYVSLFGSIITIAGARKLYEPDNNSKRVIFLILSIGLFLGCAFYVYNVRSARNVGETSKVPPTSSEPIHSVSKPLEEPKMVFVKGGTFEIGSNEYNDEKPIHAVTVSDFQIGKFEVTQAEWKVIMGKNPSYFEGDNLPVEQVSWNDVQKFLKKLNAKTGKKYRLPTEFEWEYAARGGNASKSYEFSGSNTLNDVAWNDSNSGDKTHPVGGLAGNELGINDMSGNVWEWCSNWYKGYPGSSYVDDKTGSARVIRGGRPVHGTMSCRPTDRSLGTPTYRSNDLGFRVCINPQ